MTTFRSLSSCLFVALAFTGCRIEKPATVVPSAPTVEAFTVSDATVAPGERVTLSWRTSNAASIELREVSGGDLGVSATTLEGSQEVTVDADALYVLTARGAGGSDSRAVSVDVTGGNDGTVTFTALPPIVAGGAQSTLAWSAPGASTVTLSAGGQSISTEGQVTAGAITVRPSFDTTYVLTADGATAQTTVTVQPAVLSLAATPLAAEPGDVVTVAWTAAGADRVVLTSPGRGQLYEATTPAEILAFSFSDTVPPLPGNAVLTYVVEAFKGTTRFERRVEVNVGTGLAIARFEAPPVAASGGAYQVRWQTRAADAVELRVDGALVFRTPNASQAANGLFALTAGNSDFAVELTAVNNRGGRVTQVAQVDTVGIPSAVSLVANPTAVTAGSPVTLTWASAESRRLRIVDGDGNAVFSVLGQRAEGGSTTVYPVRDTTFTATADNLLGNPSVTGTASVTVTGSAPTVTSFPPTPLGGQNVELSATPTAILHGFPHGQVLSSSQADFIDISGTGTRVLEQGGDVASVDLPFSTWIYGVRQTGPLTISRAGWLAWGAAQTVNSSETTLPSTSASAPPFLIAPFWDNLTLLATSAVYAQVVGDAPNQRLVVQWQGLQVGTTAGTEVTFQAQVHQRGTVAFQYRTMALPASPSFRIGVQDGTRTLAVTSSVTPASNSALYFFGPVVPPVDVRVTRGSRWGGFLEDGPVVALVQGTSTAVSIPQDLSLSELHFRTHAAVPAGQYMEVINRTLAPLDLTGWQLSAPGTPTFFVPAGLTLAPQVPLVLGTTTDPALNDDAGVTVAWGSSGFFFSQDAGTFTVGTADAGAGFNYSGPTDGGRGIAVEVDPGPIVGTTGSPGIAACAATTAYGSQVPPQLGSPGVLGGCFAYRRLDIAPHFVDLTDAGTPLTTATGEPTPFVLTLSDGGTPAPVTFGTARPVVSMSHDGWIVYGSVTSSNFSNRSNPSTSSNPVGAICPFWDDLEITTGSQMYWKRFAPGEDPVTPGEHWVFQWSHLRHYATSPADDLNFEVKLFVDGTIEYHYGAMVSGTTSNYASGNSATVWLEHPTAGQALVLSINQAAVQPNTAVRFVPR